MSYHKNQEKGVKMALSLIYPLGAFLYSWKDLKSRSTLWVFFLFFIVYGLCFTAELEVADSFRYVQDFKVFSANAAQNFKAALQEFFSSESEIKDIFVYVLYYLTSVIAGDNYHVFFLLVAVVFGYFYLRSLRFITKEEAFENNRFFVILVLAFTLSNPFFNINGVRFWTAAWIAVYATFEILINRKLLYFLLLFSLPLVHASFYAYIAFFLIAYLVRNYYKILPFLFFISFFFSDITLLLIPDISPYLPSFLQNMIWSYTESNDALARISGEEAAQQALYARVLLSIPRYYHIFLIFLLVRSRKFFEDSRSKEFLGFLLGVGALVNISSMIPSMMRFWNLLIPFYIYLWVRNYHIMRRYNSILYGYLFVALYPTFLLLRNVFWTTDHILFYSNTAHILIHSLING